MDNNIIGEIIKILLLFFNILLLFNIYNNNKTAKTVCLLNISILLIIKGIYMYINKLDSEFLNVLIIKIGVCSLLFIEYYIFLN